jgi:hypothetical protein
MLNRVNIHFLHVHIFFLLGLTSVLQYGTIYSLTTHVDHIVLFTL